jgi:hypothetical protein
MFWSYWDMLVQSRLQIATYVRTSVAGLITNCLPERPKNMPAVWSAPSRRYEPRASSARDRPLIEQVKQPSSGGSSEVHHMKLGRRHGCGRGNLRCHVSALSRRI